MLLSRQGDNTKGFQFIYQAPDENVIFFELGNLTFTTHNPCLTEYLEVKYRTNFVQAGAR